MLPQKRKPAGDENSQLTDSQLQKPSKIQKISDSQTAADSILQSKSVNGKINEINNKNDNEESDNEQENKKIKWKSLEHHGVTFFAAYKPHYVKVLHKGQPMSLTPEQEEICNWWAQIIDQDFAKKDIVRKNFEKSFIELFDEDQGVTSLDDFDFAPIVRYLQEFKESRKNRTTDEKKRELEERQKQDAFYKYCLIDGQLEKISNFMVEPPGIFRGRGDHPLAGKLKSRILPENVQINIGPEEPIPICNIPGHSWKRVLSNPEATWLSHFKDERTEKSNNTGKYVFLAAESKLKGENDKKKYEKARRLKQNIKIIQRNYEDKMRSQDKVDQQLGVCTYLIDKLALRVGNEKGEDEADTVGCCSLKVKNVQLEADNKITLDFLGKDSIRYLNTVDVTPIVYQNIENFQKGKGPDDELFERINASRLNDYLKEMMEDLSAKVFRTYNASVTLQTQLQEHDNQLSEADVIQKKVDFYENCNREVARLCNHQKEAAKNHDEQVIKMKDVLEQKQQKLRNLEAEMIKIKKGKGSSDPKMPKTAEQCKIQIEKAREQYEQQLSRVTKKEQNKNYALGTSKINYMDPRITISWCKHKEVPIEKIFQPTLVNKFTWAMNIEPGWEF
eukprot:403353776